jgi:hypothetical protein
MKELCPCSKLEWKETDYHLDHHPDCGKDAPSFSDMVKENQPLVYWHLGDESMGEPVMRKFESIKISYDRNEIEITSRNPDIYTMILEATQTALYFGGSVNNYQLSS